MQTSLIAESDISHSMIEMNLTVSSKNKDDSKCEVLVSERSKWMIEINSNSLKSFWTESVIGVDCCKTDSKCLIF